MRRLYLHHQAQELANIAAGREPKPKTGIMALRELPRLEGTVQEQLAQMRTFEEGAAGREEEAALMDAQSKSGYALFASAYICCADSEASLLQNWPSFGKDVCRVSQAHFLCDSSNADLPKLQVLLGNVRDLHNDGTRLGCDSEDTQVRRCSLGRSFLIEREGGDALSNCCNI